MAHNFLTAGPATLSHQPTPSPKPEEYSFAELNPTGFAGAPRGRSGAASLPGSAAPSPRLGYPAAGTACLEVGVHLVGECRFSLAVPYIDRFNDMVMIQRGGERNGVWRGS